MKVLVQILIILINFVVIFAEERRPIVVTTWAFKNATNKAWEVLNQDGKSVIDALVEGISQCETEQCDRSVGFDGSPNEEGETTLDSMLMDGENLNVGAVAGLRYIKEAVSVARHVLDYTKHTLLAGDQATEFALKMGFRNQSVSAEYNENLIKDWKDRNCQPNYWQNVIPPASESCGPYEPNKGLSSDDKISVQLLPNNHDTIGMVVIDKTGHVASGTSTNGLTYKIPGRIGDSPIVGSGSYADNTVGGAAATGDGDVMMRFSASLLATEFMRNGLSPQEAAEKVIDRINAYYPNNMAAIVVVDKFGNYGAACQIFSSFPISIYYNGLEEAKVETTVCRQVGDTTTVPTTTGGSFKVGISRLSLIFCFVTVFLYK